MAEEKEYGCVFYTDGGCKPSRGIGGWGIHGFIYIFKENKVGTGLKDHSLTDDGYVKKAKSDTVAPAYYLDATGSLIPESTNNEAELTAFLNALELIGDLLESETTPIKKARIYSDSQYVINGATEWIYGWQERGWMKGDGKEVANKDLWIKVSERLEGLKSSSIDLEYDWIKGHEGFLGNEMAHNNADLGVIAGRKGEQTNEVVYSPAPGYWKPKASVNRMFAHSRWYFNTSTDGNLHTFKDRHVYHLGDHGNDDDFLGKKMSDASFSVLFLKEPEPALEAVRVEQDRLNDRDFSTINIGRLDYIFKPAVYNMIKSKGGVYLDRQGVQRDLYTPCDLQITRELDPPRLAFNLVEVMSIMESVLKSVYEESHGEDYIITELTSLFYEQKTKGVKISDSLDTGVRSIEVPARYKLGKEIQTTPITLTIAIDTPHRNALAAFAEKKPEVFLVTWKISPHAFRYATIVKVGDDIGIWAGFYSNIFIVK